MAIVVHHTATMYYINKALSIVRSGYRNCFLCASVISAKQCPFLPLNVRPVAHATYRNNAIPKKEIDVELHILFEIFFHRFVISIHLH